MGTQKLARINHGGSHYSVVIDGLCCFPRSLTNFELGGHPSQPCSDILILKFGMAEQGLAMVCDRLFLLLYNLSCLYHAVFIFGCKQV